MVPAIIKTSKYACQIAAAWKLKILPIKTIISNRNRNGKKYVNKQREKRAEISPFRDWAEVNTADIFFFGAVSVMFGSCKFNSSFCASVLLCCEWCCLTITNQRTWRWRGDINRLTLWHTISSQCISRSLTIRVECVRLLRTNTNVSTAKRKHKSFLSSSIHFTSRVRVAEMPAIEWISYEIQGVMGIVWEQQNRK